VWKQLFRATWKTFRSRFQPFIDDLRRHKNLVETQASIHQFEEIQNMRTLAETEFRQIREGETLKQRNALQDWLAAANVQEDQEIKASVRSEYQGVCSWIQNERKYQAWRDFNSQSNPLLWITGIPGCGKFRVTGNEITIISCEATILKRHQGKQQRHRSSLNPYRTTPRVVFYSFTVNTRIKTGTPSSRSRGH